MIPEESRNGQRRFDHRTGRPGCCGRHLAPCLRHDLSRCHGDRDLGTSHFRRDHASCDDAGLFGGPFFGFGQVRADFGQLGDPPPLFVGPNLGNLCGKSSVGFCSGAVDLVLEHLFGA